MEAIFAPSSSADQPISAPCNKRMKKPSRKNNVPRSSFPSGLTKGMASTGTIHGGGGGGVFFAPSPPNYPPPSLYFSYSPSLPQQPPLLPLPLPISKSRFYSLPSSKSNIPIRGSPTATSQRTDRSSTRDQSLTPKKSSKKPTKPFQQLKNDVNVVVSSTPLPLGPDPNDLPKDVSMVLSSSSFSSSSSSTSVGVEDEVKFEELIPSCEMIISPPSPSSLPLPKFFMRPKKLNIISCTAKEASLENGATDNLRRLLRLR